MIAPGKALHLNLIALKQDSVLSLRAILSPPQIRSAQWLAQAICELDTKGVPVEASGYGRSLNGLSILRIERGGVEQKQGIEIKPGEDIADLQIFIADGTGVIRGKVKIEGDALPDGARMLASITNKLRFSNGYAQVDTDGNFAISGLAAGTYEITLNTYYPAPHQGVRLLPTLKQVVKVSDAGESQVLFTIFPGPPGHRAN